MSLNVRPADAVYDPALLVPTNNQEEVGKQVFEFVQALRRAAADGNVSVSEVFAEAVKAVPSGAIAFVALLRDEVALDEDLENVGHIVYRQLTGGV